MEEITIRRARRDDMEGVLNLVRELAVFEREPDAVEVSVVDLESDGFGADPKFHCWVAESGDQLLGMALAYRRYSTWKGPVVHLEDLIVTEAARGQGLGTALLNEVVKFAADLGVKRLSWEVLDWNEDAISFYEEKGARVLRDWDVVQLDEDGIRNYLDKL